MTIDLTNLTTIYADEQKRLTRMLVRRGMSPDAAADAVQDAFLRLLRTPVSNVRDLKSYVRRAVGNAAIDIQRERQRAGRAIDAVQGVDEAVADPAPLADATMISRQEIAALKRALDALPPRCREVLFLHKFEGLSYQETASRLGISKNTVMVHMVNALGQLRARMREENDLSK